MTPDLFRTRLASLGLTLTGFADMTGQHTTTCANWGKPRGGRMQSFPAWVEVMLSLMERQRLSA